MYARIRDWVRARVIGSVLSLDLALATQEFITSYAMFC